MRKFKYHIPTGTWPLREEPYRNFFTKLGWIEECEKLADILILPGGSDIGTFPDRDWVESMLYRSWVDREKPVLGICRGMQVMLHLTGANLVKHIPDSTDDLMHTALSGHWTGRSSWHTTELGLLTNSRHHQGFFVVPSEWNVLDKTSDGIIEAVIQKNLFGVQWHPEREEMINTKALDWWIDEVKKIL